MTRTATDRAALLANLAALRADASAKSAAFRAIDTVGAAWRDARKVANAAALLVTTEEKRIRMEGFGADGSLEMAVLGHMGRRHTDPVRTTWADLHRPLH